MRILQKRISKIESKYKGNHKSKSIKSSPDRKKCQIKTMDKIKRSQNLKINVKT
jgi:hypothetical protein